VNKICNNRLTSAYVEYTVKPCRKQVHSDDSVLTW